MFVSIVNDLGEIWQDFKQVILLNYLFWTDPKSAVPSIKSSDVGFVTLLDNQNKVVGCFVPELYELALVNGLRCQIENSPERYHEGGHEKTAFELSFIKASYSDYDIKSTDLIQKSVEDEFHYRIAKGLALPPAIYKYQIQADYLQSIAAIGLKPGVARSIKLNILNPTDKAAILERWLYYFAQRFGLLLTLVGIFTINHPASYLLVTAMVAKLMGQWCSHEFNTYSTVDNVLRLYDSMSDKNLFWGNKISLKKLIKTFLLFGAISFVTGVAAIGMWDNVMSLSLPMVLKYSGAFILSTVIATGVFLNGIAAQAYFWGFGIWHKQIDFTKETPYVAVEKVEEKLNQALQAVGSTLAEIAKTTQEPDLNLHFNAVTSHLKDSKSNKTSNCIEENAPKTQRSQICLVGV